MKIYMISHIGNSRGNQEDNALIGASYYDLDVIKSFSSDTAHCCRVEEYDIDGNTLLAVSDGMGGHSSGEIASYLTVKYLSNNYCQVLESNKADLLKMISELNREVSNESLHKSAYKGMGSTLCGVIIRERNIFGFNVGDSRLYRYENGTLVQLSTDHSEGQRLLDLKLLTRNELETFSNRKAIYKYIGINTDLIADVFEIEPCKKGAILLLCTDGITDVLTDSEIQEILNRDELLKEKGEKLLNTALERNVGHGDNITIILTEF